MYSYVLSHTLFVYWEHKSLQFMGFITDCPNVFPSLCESFIVNVTCLSPWIIIAWNFHFIQVDVQVLDIHKWIIYDNSKIVQFLLVTYDLVGFFFKLLCFLSLRTIHSTIHSPLEACLQCGTSNGITFFFFSCLAFYFIFLFRFQNQQNKTNKSMTTKIPTIFVNIRSSGIKTELAMFAFIQHMLKHE